MSHHRQIIWLTGASSGIGHGLCMSLAAQGHTVIASARNGQALTSLSKLHARQSVQGQILPVMFDVTNPLDNKELINTLNSLGGYIDKLIINAGQCEYLDFPNPRWSIIEKVMAVNFHGAVNCVEIALPFLRHNQSKHPHIVGIISQVLFADFGRSEAYGASKAALDYFLKSLRIDLLTEKIDVTSIYPGFIQTPMTANNDFSMPFLMSVKLACKRINKAINSRVNNYIFPKRLYWLLWLSKIFPNWWRRQITTTNKG